MYSLPQCSCKISLLPTSHYCAQISFYLRHFAHLRKFHETEQFSYISNASLAFPWCSVPCDRQSGCVKEMDVATMML